MKIMDAHIPKNTHTHVWEEVCKSLGRCALASKLRIPSLGTVTAVIQLVARRQWAPTARMTAVWNFPFLPPLSPLRWLLKRPQNTERTGRRRNVQWRERAAPSWGGGNDLTDQVRSFDDFVWNCKPTYFNWSLFGVDQRIFKRWGLFRKIKILCREILPQ